MGRLESSFHVCCSFDRHYLRASSVWNHPLPLPMGPSTQGTRFRRGEPTCPDDRSRAGQQQPGTFVYICPNYWPMMEGKARVHEVRLEALRCASSHCCCGLTCLATGTKTSASDIVLLASGACSVCFDDQVRHIGEISSWSHSAMDIILAKTQSRDINWH